MASVVDNGDVPSEWVVSLTIVLILATAIGGAVIIRGMSGLPPAGVSEGVDQ
jgi:hypothetical protein